MIKYYNRKTKEYEIEQVAGERYLHWTYSSPMGLALLELVVKKKLFSYLYGKHSDSKRSRKKIRGFVQSLNIDMSGFQKRIEDFTSFNDFFIRELRPGARKISLSGSQLMSPADARLMVHTNINIDKLVQIKGITYSLKELIGDSSLAERFQGGSCLIFRLCPTDYHRFHFVDSGTCSEAVKIKGRYYSVNPIALEKKVKLFCQNKREWSLFHSDHFKDIVYVEVGATCVGSIIQTYTPGKAVKKGEEKGYFKFGGSTAILFFEKDTVEIDEDILAQSASGYECRVLMGEEIGHKAPLPG